MKKIGMLLPLLIPNLALALNDSCLNLLSVINRPTVADSVCVVKDGEKIIEGGFLQTETYPFSGHAILAPQLQSRFGLPYSLEFNFSPSSYVYQYDTEDNNAAGYTATIVGLKYQFPNIIPFQFAAESLITLPLGDDDFGSEGWGLAINGIVNYLFTDTLSLEFMLGLSTQTAPPARDGGRYFTVNPDLVLAWQPVNFFQWYIEFYGQSKVSPDLGSGFNVDTGIQYLIYEYIEVDLEYGHRISGELNGFASYWGVGAGVRF